MLKIKKGLSAVICPETVTRSISDMMERLREEKAASYADRNILTPGIT